MGFWGAVFGWLVMIAYGYSLFAKPEWHFDFDRRIPQLTTLSQWWMKKGYPEWLLIGIRFIIITTILILFLNMTIRLYQNG